MIRNLLLLLLVFGFCMSCGPASQVQAEVPYFQTGVDPNEWAIIPGGEFLMGSDNHETLVDFDYEIMVTLVTNAQYAEYLNAAVAAGTVRVAGDEVVGFYEGDAFRGYKHEEEISMGDYIHLPLNHPGLRLVYVGDKFSSLAGYENHPMVQVSWFGAKAYCEASGWRLPTEVEWEKAARGTDGRPFPWGEAIARNNANFYSSHDLFEKLFGKHGNTTPVGFYNGAAYAGYQTLDSASPYGLYDMAGNVWQWTGDIYEDQHYRYLRGGSKDNYEYNLRVWTRNSAGPTYYSPAVGFRCARDF